MRQPPTPGRVWATASLIALVFCPLSVVLLQAFVGKAHLIEVFAGALVSTMFFSVTNATLMIFQESKSLKNALISSYVTKILILALVGLMLDRLSIDKRAFAIGVVTSGVAFVLVQGLLFARKRPLD